jgi:hypothetical protein
MRSRARSASVAHIDRCCRDNRRRVPRRIRRCGRNMHGTRVSATSGIPLRRLSRVHLRAFRASSAVTRATMSALFLLLKKSSSDCLANRRNRFHSRESVQVIRSRADRAGSRSRSPRRRRASQSCSAKADDRTCRHSAAHIAKHARARERIRFGAAEMPTPDVL